MNHGYEAARPSGWDPVERLKDQDLDGVVAEVLYSSLGIALFNMKNVELQQACLRVYNDWLAEFCAHNPKRLDWNRTLLARSAARCFRDRALRENGP